MLDLAIHGKVFTGSIVRAYVFVREGKIVSIKSEPTQNAERRIELSLDQVLLPAATDLHVHLRDWGQIHKETVESGTKSALAGGVTTVAEMPNTEPRLDTSATVSERAKLLSSKSYVDFAIHAGVPGKETDLASLLDSGAFAVKFYPPDLPRFSDVAKAASRLGLKVVVHGEEPSLIGTPQEADAEREAVKRIIQMPFKKAHVRFAHVSTAQVARKILNGNFSSDRVTLEVSPHHLFMTSDVAASRIGAGRAVRPPLRTKEDVRKMLKLFMSGSFQFYASDHAPHAKEEKYSSQPAPGFPGLEIALPLLLTRTEDFGLACRVYCVNPARYLGLKKGRIAPGYDADLTIIGRGPWTVDPSKFHSHGRTTPFEGETLAYAVKKVVKAGQVVFDSGKFSKAKVTYIRPSIRPTNGGAKKVMAPP